MSHPRVSFSGTPPPSVHLSHAGYLVLPTRGLQPGRSKVRESAARCEVHRGGEDRGTGAGKSGNREFVVWRLGRKICGRCVYNMQKTDLW